MQWSGRTDLALEAKEIREQQGQTLSGVKSETVTKNGFPVTTVEVLTEKGAKAIGKPVGVYLTVELQSYLENPAEQFSSAAETIGELLKELLPTEGSVFVAGLGNRLMTPDAIGPLGVEHILVTRHLKESLPYLRSVSAAAVGVLGTTGMESSEWVKGLSLDSRAIVVLDALAARNLHRLCTTIQISNTGIIPGSGVGNRRLALNEETLGVPVISMGVPTVVDGATMVADLTGSLPGNAGKDVFVTPREIDKKVKEMARLLAFGINLALQPELELEDLMGLLG